MLANADRLNQFNMQAIEFNEWYLYPRHLKLAEISNPLSVLADFFYDDWLPGHLNRLKEWRDYILKDDYFRGKKNSPAELLYFHKLNLCLIEAVYLLKDDDDSISTQQQLDNLTGEKSDWRDFPNNLNEAELLDPYLVFKDFFANYSLPQYREILYDWLEHGLSCKAANEFIETKDLLKVYENLQKLYSATWLIHQRTSGKPYLNDKISDAADKSYLRECASRKNALNEISIYRLNPNLSAVPGEMITNLISIIKHKVPSVQAVFYLGATPNATNKLFLLVLTANDEQMQAQALSSMIEESCQKAANIVALVHHATALFAALNQNNFFFGKALNCPVIYLSGDLLLPPVKPANYFSTDEAALTNWKHWHNQGNDFLSGADYYLQTGAINAALFSLHQCVECFLIAIVRAVLDYRVNSHNLSKLLHISQMFTGDLIAVFELDKPESMQLFDLLKHAYVNVRYRDTFEPDTKSVETLYRVTRSFVSVTEQVYQRHLLAATI
jgi:HEPN domain-containing protein